MDSRVNATENNHGHPLGRDVVGINHNLTLMYINGINHEQIDDLVRASLGLIEVSISNE